MIPHSILVLYRLLSLLCALAHLKPHTNLPFSGEEFWSSERLSTLLEGTQLMNAGAGSSAQSHFILPGPSEQFPHLPGGLDGNC